jgi:hypothetical protein
VVAPNFAIRGKFLDGKVWWLLGEPVYGDPDDYLVDDLAEATILLEQARVAGRRLD